MTRLSKRHSSQHLSVAGFIRICIWIALLASASHVASAQQPSASNSSPATTANPLLSGISSMRPPDDRYRIGIGDVLDIRVFNKPQFSRDSVRVDSHGMIRMPLIREEIQAAYHTEEELAKEITTLKLEYVK